MASVGEALVYTSSQPSVQVRQIRTQAVICWKCDLLPLSPSSPSSWTMIFALRLAAKEELIVSHERFRTPTEAMEESCKLGNCLRCLALDRGSVEKVDAGTYFSPTLEHTLTDYDDMRLK